MTSALNFNDIRILKLKPKKNNKCIICVISRDTYNKIQNINNKIITNERWKYKIIVVELDLFLKKIISVENYKTYIDYKIPSFSNDNLVVQISIDSNNKLLFDSKYYISKFIKKALILSCFDLKYY